MRQFCFRVLRQNRRLAPATDPSKQAALEEFHQVLEDVAHNRDTLLVRRHLLAAYVRGAMQNPHRVDMETTTGCFTKKSYRVRWNRIVCSPRHHC